MSLLGPTRHDHVRFALVNLGHGFLTGHTTRADDAHAPPGVGLFAQTFGLTAAAMMRILEHNAVRADVPRRSQAPERTIRGLTFWAGTIPVDAVYFSVKAKVGSMTDEQLAAMHRLLSEYHRKLAKEAALDVVQQYHTDLAQRLADAFMSANNKNRTTVMSKNDMPALRRVIAPAELERATA
jgi:hypothetical protein